MELPYHQRLIEESRVRLAEQRAKEFKAIRFIVRIPALNMDNFITMSLPLDRLKEEDTIILDVQLGDELLEAFERGKKRAGRPRKSTPDSGGGNDDGIGVLGICEEWSPPEVETMGSDIPVPSSSETPKQERQQEA